MIRLPNRFKICSRISNSLALDSKVPFKLILDPCNWMMVSRQTNKLFLKDSKNLVRFSVFDPKEDKFESLVDTSKK